MKHFNDLFTGLGCFDKEYDIKLKADAKPIAHAARRVPQALKNKLKKKLDELVKNKIIEKVDDYSEWVQYLSVVEKKDVDKSLRLCIDPQELNENMADEHTQTPTFDEVSSKLANMKYFSVLDLKDGFWHVNLSPESRKLCTFATPFGNYRFIRMPFGIKNGPSVFQRKIFENFGDIPNIIIYFDDILIYGQDRKEHDDTLLKVLHRAREKNVRFNVNKSQIATQRVKYLGHFFSCNEINPDQDRISAIKEMGCPKSKKDLQTFLGFINTMRQFIPNLSDKTAPLRELLKKNSEFVWTEVHDGTVSKLKEDIINSKILIPFDENKPLVVQCDASGHGLGAGLFQNNRPIAFASRSLNDAEKNYSQIEKELLSILFACTKFHYYTYGRPIKVINDHKPLLGIMKKDLHKIASSKLQRMKMKLFNYDIQLEHAPGKTIQLADYLSRYESKTEQNEDTTINESVLTINASDEKKLQIKNEIESDANLKKIKEFCKSGWPNNKKNCPENLRYYYRLKDDIFIDDDLLFYNDRLIIPTKMREEIINKLHEPHFGITKTIQRAANSVYWPNINNEIENLINNCTVCQMNASKNINEPMIPHEIPKRPFVKIGCDILEFKGKNYLALMDYFSKWIELVKINHMTANEINKQWLKIFAAHGYPNIIIADNVPFGSYECAQFAKKYDIKIVTSSPRYPKSNGLAEKTVSICKNILRKCNGDDDIQKALLAYRTTPVKYTSYSPAQLLYNRMLRTELPMHDNKFKAELNHKIENQMKNKTEKMKACYDKSTRVRDTFTEGQSIIFQNNKKWQTGQIINKHSTPRSFNIQSDGRTYRRNTNHIRPFRTNTQNIRNNNTEVESSPQLHTKTTRSGRTY